MLGRRFMRGWQWSSVPKLASSLVNGTHFFKTPRIPFTYILTAILPIYNDDTASLPKQNHSRSIDYRSSPMPAKNDIEFFCPSFFASLGIDCLRYDIYYRLCCMFP